MDKESCYRMVEQVARSCPKLIRAKAGLFPTLSGAEIAELEKKRKNINSELTRKCSPECIVNLVDGFNGCGDETAQQIYRRRVDTRQGVG